MRYVVSVGEETLEVNVEQNADGSYRVSGAAGPDLRVLPLGSRSDLVSLLVGEHALEVQPSECEVHYQAQRFMARAESWLQRALKASSGTNGAQAKKVVASMPGRIVRVSCEPGHEVHEGTPLIVIEAMKMQNELCAKGSAIVSAVRVSVGQTVERGALLVEFE